MSAPTQQNNTQNKKSEEEIIFESIDFFVRMMSIMGFPRSVGEIYGLLYFSQQPLSMDKIMNRLRISLGSASQGLKSLRSLKAVRTVYIQGERKDHFVAETEFRRLFSNFIKDEILPHLDSASERISRIESHVSGKDKIDQEFYEIRLEKLRRLTKAGKRLLPALSGLLKL